jgi:hypothetical protein
LLRIAASPRNTATIPPPRRSRNWRAKPACRWPSRKNFTETAGRGVKAEVGGEKFWWAGAMAQRQRCADEFEKSVDLNETEGWSLIFVLATANASAGSACRTRPAPKRRNRSSS